VPPVLDIRDLEIRFATPDGRANFRRQVTAFLASDKYHGLMVDFESFPKSGQAGYVAVPARRPVPRHG